MTSPYIALARKWRPQTFSALVGQSHISKALTHALHHNRLHHAYLFTGTHGVGKTSVARLFAKCLSCEQGPNPEPCLTCSTCKAIQQGAYIDLIEIDAASKTKVEDTRELLDNVAYAPSQGRYKIYLIDEVHMLSTHSFNALLKTLEEPPSHVKFLLATTEPQKLPMTVRSRCLQFHLQALNIDLICHHLQTILDDESITYETEATTLIAQEAHGSMRDALSLLDQIINLSDNQLSISNVKSALGYTQRDYAPLIVEAIQQQNAKQLLSISHEIYQQGGQYIYVLNALLTYLHQMACNQTNQPPSPNSNTLTPETLQLMYHIALKGREELLLAPTPAIGFEMTLLRLHTFNPEVQHPPLNKSLPASPIMQNQSEPSSNHPNSPVTPVQNDKWEQILPQLNLSGLALNAAKHADLKFNTENQASFKIHQQYKSLFTPNTLKKIEEGLSSYFNRAIQLKLEASDISPHTPAEMKRQKAEQARAQQEKKLNQDPAFQHLKQTFEADI